MEGSWLRRGEVVRGDALLFGCESCEACGAWVGSEAWLCACDRDDELLMPPISVSAMVRGGLVIFFRGTELVCMMTAGDVDG